MNIQYNRENIIPMFGWGQKKKTWFQLIDVSISVYPLKW